MNEVYLKYYKNKTRKIFEDELGELSSYKYLKYTNDFYYELKNNVYIGKIDKRAPFAFLLNEDDDIYIDRKEASSLMDGDIALIELVKGEAKVREILKRGLENIIATVVKRRGGFKYYTDKPLGRNILVDD